MLKARSLALLILASPFVVSLANAAPITLEGMGQIKQWTDFESESANEMPDFIWGTSDTDGADRIGLHVLFENGLEGSATYSGVSSLWNTSNFAGVAADTATGFFTSAGGMHFLFNTAATTSYPDALPIAWTSFVMDFSNNFDLDYNVFFGSNFRASVAGWGSAVFTTYSSTARVAVPEPGTLALLATGILAMGLRRRRRKA